MNTPTTPVDFPPLLTHTAAELLEKDLPPLRMVIDSHVPARLLLLAGDPKVGKTLLLLGLAVAVANGDPAWGDLKVAHGDCLYLALEGGERSLQSRLSTMTKDRAMPDRLHLTYECNQLDKGLATQLETWLYSVPEPRLIVVDTFAAVAPQQRGVNRLTEEYKALQPLADLARRWPDTLIVLVHHTRKAESEDVMHRINGGMGLTAATDCNAVFTRKPGARQCVLTLRPRDTEESELLLQLDQDTLQWQKVERNELARLDERRREVLEWVTRQAEPVTPKSLTEALCGEPAANRRLLMKMANDGQLQKPARGQYAAVGHKGHNSHKQT